MKRICKCIACKYTLINEAVLNVNETALFSYLITETTLVYH